MKKFVKKISLLLLFSFLYNLLYSQDSIINKSNYTICWDFKLRQPKWITYHVICDGSQNNKRPPIRNIKGYTTLIDKDYKGFDKGHLMPFESVSCDSLAKEESMLAINFIRQNRALNRGVWRSLENYERLLYKQGFEVNVRIDIEYKNSFPYLLKKSLLYNNIVEEYIFLNKKPVYKILEMYRHKKKGS